MSSKIRNINKLDINKQMALPLKFKSIKNRENYFVSECNIEAVKLIENSNVVAKKIKNKLTLVDIESNVSITTSSSSTLLNLEHM